jgi:hypothetical protein
VQGWRADGKAVLHLHDNDYDYHTFWRITKFIWGMGRRDAWEKVSVLFAGKSCGSHLLPTYLTAKVGFRNKDGYQRFCVLLILRQSAFPASA